MVPDVGFGKRRLLLAVQVITVSSQLLELVVLVFAPDVKTFGAPASDNGRHFRSSYDFIVIGDSPASAVIASRLSELQQWSVLLLQAAEDEHEMDQPSSHPLLPRNVYLRGSQREFDDWALAGNIGWDYNNVLNYFKKSEDMRVPKYSNSEHHGIGGYFSLEEYKSYSPITDLILSAGNELGYDVNVDLNSDIEFGFSRLYGALRNGLWCSTSRAFLRPARHRENLDISYSSRVKRIVIDPVSKQVVGVVFNKFGEKFVVRSNKETIISAGAIKSAQLLMLSGVGPEKHLKELGLTPIIADLPVGYNLQDHKGLLGPSCTLKHSISSLYSSISNVKTMFQKVFNEDEATFGDNLWETVAFLSTKYDNSSGLADVAVFMSGSDVYSREKDSFSTLGVLLRPISRGRVLLRSNDSEVAPAIHANYLSEGNDVKVLAETVKIGLELCNSSVLHAYGAEVNPSSLGSCGSMSEDNFKERIVSLGHHSGTCRMGPDTDSAAVVDDHLRVRGVLGLRVADSSIMPTILSADLTAICVMIGEKVSELIRTQWMATASSTVEYC